MTADFMYLRLHGANELYASGYSDAMLDTWAERICAWRRGGEPSDAQRVSSVTPPPCASRDVFCYFDNTAKEHAPRNAARLQALLA